MITNSNMEVPQINSQQSAFTILFINGISFEEYQTEATENVKESMKTAIEVTQKQLAKLTPEEAERLNIPINILIIGETWCGDCKNNLPVAVTMANHFSNWNYRIVLRDSQVDIIQQYYTLGGRMKIPFIILADEENYEFDRWIERPTRNYKVVAELKALRLPKEEFISQYRAHPLLKVEEIANETFNELMQKINRMVAIKAILPKAN